MARQFSRTNVGVLGLVALALLVAAESYLVPTAKADCTEPEFAWSFSIVDGDDWVTPNDVAIDSLGDIVVVGTFRGAKDFDPSDGIDIHTSLNQAQFVSKFGPDGAYKWTYAVTEQGEHSSNAALALDIGDMDEIYVTGWLNGGTVDFDPTDGEDVHTNAAGTVFVTKLDVNGGHIWTYTPTSELSGSRGTYYIAHSSSDGRVVVGGSMSQSLSLPYVLSISPTGIGEWFEEFERYQFGPPLIIEGLGVDDNANITLTMSYDARRTVDLDPTDGVDLHTGGTTQGAAFGIVRLGTDGSFQWASHLGQTGGSIFPADLHVTRDGQLWVVGDFGGTIDFDPGSGTSMITSKEERNLYVCSFSQAGELVGTQTLDALSPWASRVDTDSTGNPVILGHASQSIDELVDLDPTDGVDIHRPEYNGDSFISKYYSYGWYAWSLMDELTVGDEIRDIAVGPDDSVVIIGKFGDPTNLPTGMYVTRFGAVPLPIRILTNTPENNWVDARQDRSLSGRTPHGIDRVRMTFSCRVQDEVTEAPIDPSSFAITDTGDTGQVIFGVQEVEDAPNTYDILLADPIPAGEWTTIVANVATLDGTSAVVGEDDRVTVGFLPGDVNGDHVSSPADILSLIDGLNGIVVPPLGIHQCDLDRSDACNGADILRLVDLLNGVATTRPWLGESLP